MILLVADNEAVVSLRASARQDEMSVERAEITQDDLFFTEQTVARVERLQRVFLSGWNHIAILRNLSQAASDVDQVPCAVGGSVGVEIAFVGQPLCHADTLQADHVRGHVSVQQGEHSHVIGVAQLFVRLLKYPIVLCRRLGKDLVAVGNQQSQPGARAFR